MSPEDSAEKPSELGLNETQRMKTLSQDFYNFIIMFRDLLVPCSWRLTKVKKLAL